MRRRLFIALATAGIGSLAGCADRAPADQESTATSTASLPASVGDVELPVPTEEIRAPLARDAIPAIVEPAFAEDWGGLDPDDVDDPTLPDDTAVIGVERDDRARAYPLRILNWHEIVNDSFGGAIAVTYCVLCGSSVVVERRVDGQETIFGVSGRLWRNDLVMYDRLTESLWSQLLATAIRGPQTGEQLRILPSTLTTWDEWRRSHPETTVLLPPPHSNTLRGREQTYRYFDDKYNYDDQSQLIGYDARDGERRRRTVVIGVTNGDRARAYPFDVVQREGVVHDEVGDLPVVVALAPDDTLVAYDRRVDGRARTFEAPDERYLAAAGSRWERTTGRAVDGPYAGDELDRANEHPPMFWEGWSNFNPDTTVYGDEGR